jgi:hypothetical protein
VPHHRSLGISSTLWHGKERIARCTGGVRCQLGARLLLLQCLEVIWSPLGKERSAIVCGIRNPKETGAIKYVALTVRSIHQLLAGIGDTTGVLSLRGKILQQVSEDANTNANKSVTAFWEWGRLGLAVFRILFWILKRDARDSCLLD